MIGMQCIAKKAKGLTATYTPIKYIVFKTILVAVDGSEQSMKAVDVAISMANKYGAKLTAIHLAIFPFDERDHPSPQLQKAFDEEVHTQTSQWFTDIKRRGKENNVEVKTELIVTSKSIQYGISEYADAQKTELIVIGSRGKSGIEKLYLGSVASAILTYVSCTVMVVR
jgi:nucleotide-binding universal stress UspA family protein